MASSDEYDLRIKQKQPRTYIPVRAEKIERGKSYASVMVNDQKTMLANLRWLKHQMDKEERQLKIMKEKLYDRNLQTKWSSYHQTEGTTDRWYSGVDRCSSTSCMPPKHLPSKPSALSRREMIEYGKLQGDVLVNDQIVMMENLRRLKRQIASDDRQVDAFMGRKLKDKNDNFAHDKHLSYTRKTNQKTSNNFKVDSVDNGFKRLPLKLLWKKGLIEDFAPNYWDVERSFTAINGERNSIRKPRWSRNYNAEESYIDPGYNSRQYSSALYRHQMTPSDPCGYQVYTSVHRNPHGQVDEMVFERSGEEYDGRNHSVSSDGRRMLDMVDQLCDTRSGKW